MENNLNGKKKMRLEDLDKKNIHSVPEAYFDKLPYSIQERIHQKESSWFEKLKLSPVKYAIPAFSILIGLAIYLFLKPSQVQIAQSKKHDIKGSEKVDVIKQKKEFNDSVHYQENKKEKKEDIKITAPGSTNIPVQEENKNIADISKTEDSNKTVEQYLAGISKEDIRTYLVINDLDESQMEELMIEN
jgi:hypothetical protein